MTKLTSIYGVVSHIERFSNTSGSISGSTFQGTGSISGSIQTDERTLFRINNRPVSYPGTPSISSGEEITLVVKGRRETGVAIKNHGTGATYSIGLITEKEVVKALTASGLFIVFGLLTLIFAQGAGFLTLALLGSSVLCGQALSKRKFREQVYQLVEEKASSSSNATTLPSVISIVRWCLRH